MKYLKKFETIRFPFIYWKVPTKEPDIFIAISKLKGCTIKKEDLYSSRSEYLQTVKPDYPGYFFIIHNLQQDSWFWMDSIENQISDNLKYKGEVKITVKDVEKYYLEQDANKYNL